MKGGEMAAVATARPTAAPTAAARQLDVESNVQDVAVLDHVRLTLETLEAASRGLRV